jgi:hypothetical protein
VIIQVRENLLPRAITNVFHMLLPQFLSDTVYIQIHRLNFRCSPQIRNVCVLYVWSIFYQTNNVCQFLSAHFSYENAPLRPNVHRRSEIGVENDKWHLWDKIRILYALIITLVVQWYRLLDLVNTVKYIFIYYTTAHF